MIPTGFFEEVYALPTVTTEECVVPSCFHEYREGVDHYSLDRVLLPGEKEFLDTFQGEDKRSFVFRSYPIRVHKLGEHSLTVWSAIKCPHAPTDIDTPLMAHRLWVGAWKALVNLAPDEWWDSIARTLPQGYQHLGDLLDPRENGVPSQLLARVADTSCEQCGGTGLDPDRGVCSCLSEDKVKQLHAMVMDASNSFRV